MIVDDSLERRIWNIDNSVEKFFELFCFCCVNIWIIDLSLLVHWRVVDASLKKHWCYCQDFDANNMNLNCYDWPNLRNIDVSLLLRRWSLMMLCIEVFETLIISMDIFLTFIVFVMLRSESLMFQCFFDDDSLMTLWRTIEVTAKISLQALLTFKGFIDLISETLMFHCCFVDDRWWFVGETYLKHW